MSGPDGGQLSSMQGGSVTSAPPVPGSVTGGRLLGVFGDVSGVLPGMTNVQGWAAKQISSPFGSLFSGEQKPGMLSQLGLSRAGIWEQVKQATSNAGMQAVVQANTAGVENVPMAQSGQLSSAGAPMAASAAGRGDIEIG